MILLYLGVLHNMERIGEMEESRTEADDDSSYDSSYDSLDDSSYDSLDKDDDTCIDNLDVHNPCVA